MKSYLNFVRQLNLPEESAAMMLSGNARRLFKLDVPA